LWRRHHRFGLRGFVLALLLGGLLIAHHLKANDKDDGEEDKAADTENK
jgi:hypothetical protein